MQDIDAAILNFESLRDEQGSVLKRSLFETYEKSKPINLLRTALKDVSDSNNIQDTILTSGLSLASAYFTKKLILSESTSKTKKLIGSVLLLFTSTVMNKNGVSLMKLKSSIFNFVKVNLNKIFRSENQE